ncbi:GNAT family N-acetyltransferase [Sphingopyxis witflariensis]|uniref:GNAT family N-acetyltransferase n=1 Tax=Sphingopyxis witflariensis TaxID=173675 RepID=A0A2D0AN40_9SPHN|nr:GNAT family N-acetyltransferase [Sphingopyxis witflariensis]OWQ95172.1 GNAT family N-acetyltransferase [Sphingopyxis witflariensis]
MSGAGVWRPMRADDLPTVVRISDAVHGDFTEPLETFVDRLAHYPAGCAILDRDGEALGYLIGHPWPRDAAPPKLGVRMDSIPTSDSYYLHDIALLPAARGTGAGATATAFVVHQAEVEGCRDVRLVAIQGADSYWHRQGFDYVAADPYGPGSHLMQRVL